MLNNSYYFIVYSYRSGTYFNDKRKSSEFIPRTVKMARVKSEKWDCKEGIQNYFPETNYKSRL